MLYMDMEENVKRQMLRATSAALHNKHAADAGSENMSEPINGLSTALVVLT